MQKKKQNKNQVSKQVSKFDITKFELLRDLILVKALRNSSDDLYDPEQYEDKPEFGEIVKIGETTLDSRLKVGRIIRFGKYSTEAIRTNGEDYYLIHEEDCHAFLP